MDSTTKTLNKEVLKTTILIIAKANEYNKIQMKLQVFIKSNDAHRHN